MGIAWHIDASNVVWTLFYLNIIYWNIYSKS